jgi:archaellum component FlaF (FlaF/FlaG flagellin family)
MESYQLGTGYNATELYVTLRNMGPTSVNLEGADYFLDGNMDKPWTIVMQNPSTVTQFQPGTSAQLTFFAWCGRSECVAGQTYVLKIVTENGIFFEFQIVWP